MSLNILHLKCVNCGAGLEISPDMVRFACGYCGAEQIVERKGGTVALKQITDAISRVQIGTDKTASELAIRRLQEELNQIGANYHQRIRRAVGQKSGLPSLAITIGIASFGISMFIGVLAESVIKDSAVLVWMVGLGIGGVLAFVIKMRRDKEVDEDLRRDLEAITAQGNEIHKRLAKHKKIVDS